MRRIPNLLLLLALMVFVAACDNADPDGDGDLAGPISVESDVFALVETEDAFANITDGTLNSRGSMDAVLGGSGRMLHPDRHMRRSSGHLRPILRRLHLRPMQHREIGQAILRHRLRIRPYLEAIRALNQDIIDTVNAEREAILAALDAGEIDEAEARSQLREVNREMHQAIRGNPANEPYNQEICASREQLFDEIREILTPTQQIDWDAWVAMNRGCD